MITAFPFASRESKTYLRRNAASPLEEAEIDAALVALGFNTLACGFAELAVPSLAPVTYDADKKRLKVAQMEAVLPFMRGEHTVDRRTMGAGKTLVMAIVLKILKARQPSGFLWLLDPTRDLTKDHAQRFRDFGFNVVAYDPEAPNAEEQRVPSTPLSLVQLECRTTLGFSFLLVSCYPLRITMSASSENDHGRCVRPHDYLARGASIARNKLAHNQVSYSLVFHRQLPQPSEA
jgi:hypothetical protein